MRALLAVLALVGLLAAPALPALPLGLSVALEAAATSKEKIAYPVLNLEGERIGSATWVVVQGTGNCCEHYLAATAEGLLLDFGGDYLHYTRDSGRSWTQVRTLVPPVAGEGAVAVAPSGDILGLGWDAYTGDHLVALVMDGATGTWTAFDAPLHTPFFDRPYLMALARPGDPMEVAQRPFVAVATGGWPMRELAWASDDGQQYTHVASATAGAAGLPAETRWLDVATSPTAPEASAPPAKSGLMPLPDGRALALATGWSPVPTCPWRAVREDTQWPCFALPSGALPQGVVRIDGRGWAHFVEVGDAAFTHHLSRDGGRTWVDNTYALPPDHVAEGWDVQVRAGDDVAAVAIHARDTAADVHRDLLYVLRNVGTGVPAVTLYQVGNGDLRFGDQFGVGDQPRFDFMSAAILPGGRVALSFGDKAHPEPGLAIMP